MTYNSGRQDRSVEKKIVETEETVRKGYRPSGPPLDPKTTFEPQPTRATPEPPPTPAPEPPSTGNDTGNSDS